MTDTPEILENTAAAPADESAHTAASTHAAPAQAATDAAPATATAGRAAKQPKAPASPRGRKPPHPVLEQLFALYPGLFGARFLPLKLGVYDDLLARHPEVLDKAGLKVALGLHARSMRYLEAVAAGHPRHDLDGIAVGPVAPEHVHHAVREVFRRREARQPGVDQRPALVAHLVRAIEASGLDCDAYLERVRVSDDDGAALLEEAFAVLGAQAAKREALRRAFASSGKTVAEFAEMYGLDLRDAQWVLAPVAAAPDPAALAARTETAPAP